jgi:hypothetical protein
MNERSTSSAIGLRIAGTLVALGMVSAVATALPACSKSTEEPNAIQGSARLEGEYSFPASSSLAGIYFKNDRYLLVTRSGKRTVGNFTFDDRVLKLVDASTGDVITIRVDKSTLKRPSSTAPRSGGAAIGIRSFGGGDAPITVGEGDNGCQNDAFANDVPTSEDGGTAIQNFVGGGGGALVSDDGEEPIVDNGNGGAIVENDGGAFLDMRSAGLLCAAIAPEGGSERNVCCAVASLLTDAIVQAVSRGQSGSGGANDGTGSAGEPGESGDAGASSLPVNEGERLGDMVQGASDAGSICTGTDCNLDEVTPGAPCTDNRSCNHGAKGVGVVCSTTGTTRGRCIEGCHSDDDCAGSTCDKTGPRWRCTSPLPRLGTACNGDNAVCSGGRAGAGRVCSTRNQQCIVGCHADSDCGGGAKCDKTGSTWVCSDGRPTTSTPGNASPDAPTSSAGHIWPMRLDGNSSCGPRCEFGYARGRLHAGIDIGGYGSGSNPDDVWATKDGVVDYAGWASGYGNMVDILHSDGIMTRYAHLASMRVRTGDTVRQGQVVGIRGNTGGNFEIHLHYEMRPNSRAGSPGSPVDPRSLLPRPGVYRF